MSSNCMRNIAIAQMGLYWKSHAQEQISVEMIRTGLALEWIALKPHETP